VVAGSSYIYGMLFLCMFLMINYISWIKQLVASQFFEHFDHHCPLKLLIYHALFTHMFTSTLKALSSTNM